MKIKNSLWGTLGLVVAAAAVPAFAQESTFLEEIVVTAAKRQQTLQEIPVAVSVLQADDLNKSQVLDVKDLQFLVPSLRVGQLQSSGNTNFFIRGFGNGANNAGIEPSVGVFIDGVYRSRSASALNDFPNLERIEVLRGPQSTLFGKNASAGVISVVTAKPALDKTTGSAAVTLGDYSQVIVQGDINGPLSDTVGFGLSASFNQRDGYYENLAGGDALGELNRWGVRGHTGRAMRCGSTSTSPISPISIRTAGSSRPTAIATWRTWPTGCGIRTARSSASPRAIRYCRRMSCRRMAARRNSPTRSHCNESGTSRSRSCSNTSPPVAPTPM